MHDSTNVHNGTRKGEPSMSKKQIIILASAVGAAVAAVTTVVILVANKKKKQAKLAEVEDELIEALAEEVVEAAEELADAE